MNKCTKYNLYVWAWIIMALCFLKILYMFSPNLYAKLNISTIIFLPVVLFAFLGTAWVGCEIRIIAIKADFIFFDIVKNVYFKMLFRLAFTGLHVYILFQILVYVLHADCIRRYGIGVCVPR